MREAWTASRHARAEPAAADRAEVAGRAGAGSPALMPAVADTAAVAPVDADSAANRVGARPRRAAPPAAAAAVDEMRGASQCFPTAGPAPLAAVAVPDTSAAPVDVAVARGAVEAPAGDSDTRAHLPLPAGPPPAAVPETAGDDRQDPDAMPPG